MKKTLRLDGHRHDVVARVTGERFHVQIDGDRAIEGARRWDGATLELALGPGARRVRIVVVRGAGGRLELWRDSERHVVEEERRGGSGGGGANGGADDALVAPMPAKVVRVSVAAGDAVEEGQTLVVLESMKMELGLTAPRAGRVARVDASEGVLVQAGSRRGELEPVAGASD